MKKQKLVRGLQVAALVSTINPVSMLVSAQGIDGDELENQLDLWEDYLTEADLSNDDEERGGTASLEGEEVGELAEGDYPEYLIELESFINENRSLLSQRRIDLLIAINDFEWEITASLQGWGAFTRIEFTPASWQQMEHALTQARQMQALDWQLNLNYQQLESMRDQLQNGINGLTPANEVVLRTAVTNAGVNFRRGPGAGHDRIRLLGAHTQVDVLVVVGDWSRVRIGNERGYVSSRFLTELNRSGQVIVNTNFRSGPGTSHGVIRTLPRNSRVTILGENLNWTRVRVGSEVGFVSTQLIGENIFEAQISGGVNFRRGPGTSHGVIRMLPRGTNVTVLRQNGNWSRVRVNGQTGYVSSRFLTWTAITGNLTVNANFRTGPGTSHSRIRVAARGSHAVVLDRRGSWTQVRIGNETGWVSSRFLQLN